MTGVGQVDPIERIRHELGARRRMRRWTWAGDPNPEILVAGQSHRVALLAAYQQSLTHVRGAVLSSKDGAMDIDPSYWAMAATTKTSLPIVVAWTGNSAIMKFLFVGAQPFRLVTDKPVAADASKPVVPAEAVKEYLAQWDGGFERLRGVLDELKSHPRVVIGTPPPKSAAIIASRLRDGAIPDRIMKEHGVDPSQATIAPVELRVAIWELVQELLHEIATEKDALFVPVPESVKAADGTLHRSLSTMDISHGNARYGALIWAAVSDALKQSSAP
jgi:hypothetical protein